MDREWRVVGLYRRVRAAPGSARGPSPRLSALRRRGLRDIGSLRRPGNRSWPCTSLVGIAYFRFRLKRGAQVSQRLGTNCAHVMLRLAEHFRDLWVLVVLQV